MQHYKSINQKRPSKLKRLMIVLLIVVVLILMFLGVIGLIKDSDSAEHQNVSAAVEENLQLKRQVTELQQEIADLQEQINEMSAVMAAMPTPEPSQSPIPIQ